MVENVVIYSNCHGTILASMFQSHGYTKRKYNVTHISNYMNLSTNYGMISSEHFQMLSTCDIFIYQPFNKTFHENPYDINNVLFFLKPSCKTYRVSYYRFRGFWFECDHKPYDTYKQYRFPCESHDVGIHRSLKEFRGDYSQLINHIDHIEIDPIQYFVFFQEELNKLKKLDDTCDVNMLPFFLENFKQRTLFHDPFHPTLFFFYEIFRQLIYQMTNIHIDPKDDMFLSCIETSELTMWSQPILPCIKNILQMQIPSMFYLFDGVHDAHIVHINIYQYYYIRLKKEHFEHYLTHGLS